jgi:hypothetical protein
VRCHGGTDGIAAGMDLSGGWTEHFSISYENLVSRRQSQLVAYWIAGIDCMNGRLWSSGLRARPRLGIRVGGVIGRTTAGRRTEPQGVICSAWIDTSPTTAWDYTQNGAGPTGTPRPGGWGCSSPPMRCHGDGKRHFGGDWISEGPGRADPSRALGAGGRGG